MSSRLFWVKRFFSFRNGLLLVAIGLIAFGAHTPRAIGYWATANGSKVCVPRSQVAFLNGVNLVSAKGVRAPLVVYNSRGVLLAKVQPVGSVFSVPVSASAATFGYLYRSFTVSHVAC